MQLAGELGSHPLSHAAPPWGALRPGQSVGIDRLASQWDVYQRAAAAGGHQADRASWRIVIPLHVSTDRDTALAELYPGWERMRRELWMHNFAMPMSRHPEAASRAFEATVAQGGIIAGSAADCVSQIRALAKQAGGFGTLLVGCLDWAELEQQRRSLQLFARHVAPALRNTLLPLRDSAVLARTVAQRLQDDHHAAAAAASTPSRLAQPEGVALR
jgi:limonene 1,2-monooxygenase